MERTIVIRIDNETDTKLNKLMREWNTSAGEVISELISEWWAMCCES